MNPLLTQAIDLLSYGQMKDAMTLTKQYASESRLSYISDEINSLRQSYDYLLKYLREGVNDSSRERFYKNIRYKFYALLRNLILAEESKESSKLYFSVKRSIEFSGITFGNALGRFLSSDSGLQLTPLYDDNKVITEESKKLLAEKDRALKDVFNSIWTLPLGEKSQLEQIVNVASDMDISYQLRAIIVSALTLSLMQAFDEKKLAALIEIDNRSQDVRINARAIAGIVIILSCYARLNITGSDLELRFDAWLDDIVNFSRLKDVVFSIVKTRGSSKLNDKISKDLYSDFASVSRDILKDIQKRDKPLTLEDIQENPEWEKAMIDSGLDKKLRKLHSLHDKGADMMLPMFRQLSGHHFFKDPDVWFRPYDSWEAIRLGIDPSLASAIGDTPSTMILCDSDKFAMLLNFSRMTGPMAGMMSDALKMGKQEMSEELSEISVLKSDPIFNVEVINYLRSLFRFFNYFRSHKDFFNPFENIIVFEDLPVIGNILRDDEIQRTIAETYFNQQYYGPAASCYLKIAETHPDDEAMLTQKGAYCYEKESNFSEALRLYRLADEMKENEDGWMLERIAYLAEKVNNSSLVLLTLERLIKLDPNNMEYLKKWLTLKLYEVKEIEREERNLIDQRLSKLLYLDPENSDNLSISAFNNFLKGNFQDAIEILDARKNEIEMYLAESSLNIKSVPTAGNQSDENLILQNEECMMEDLLLITSSYVALEDYAKAVASIKMIFYLKSEIDAKKLGKRMESLWKRVSPLSERLIMIPLLMEAAVE